MGHPAVMRATRQAFLSAGFSSVNAAILGEQTAHAGESA